MKLYWNSKMNRSSAFLAIILALPLSGCDSAYHRVEFQLVPEWFKDCETAYIQNNEGVGLYVTRCPNSTTSTMYRAGKTTINSVVIDRIAPVGKVDMDKHDQ